MSRKPGTKDIIPAFVFGNLLMAISFGWLEGSAILRLFLGLCAVVLFAWALYNAAVHAAFVKVEVYRERKEAESITETSEILGKVAIMKPSTIEFLERQSIVIRSVPLVTGSVHVYTLPGLYPRVEVDGRFVRRFIRESTVDYIAPMRRFGEREREIYGKFIEWLKVERFVAENAGAAGPRTLPWLDRTRFAAFCKRFDIEYATCQQEASAGAEERPSAKYARAGGVYAEDGAK